MSVCRGCGKTIILATLNTGGSVPLDPSPPVYEVMWDPPRNPIATRLAKAMVSHFITCPNANQFSGSKNRTTKETPKDEKRPF